MSFLIPLITVLGTIATVVLIVIGLVSVPWPVLLLLLVAGWIAAQRALASIQSAEIRPIPAGPVLDELTPMSATSTVLKHPALDTVSSNNLTTPVTSPVTGPDLKGKCLKYRGAVYECPEGVPDQPECCEIEVIGKYRGSPSTVHLRGKTLVSE